MSNKCAKCNDYSWIKIITKCDTKVKRNVPEVLKRIVGYEQDYKCNICAEKLDPSYEIDHIIPLYKGGLNERKNLQALSRKENYW